MKRTGKLTTAATALFTVALFSLVACQRLRKDKDDDVDSTVGTEHALLEKTYSDALSISDEAATNGTLASYRGTGNTMLSTCATITHDTISVPHVLTIDFGATNCICKDGINRRGQIIVTYTGRYRDAGHVHTISFNNYYANDNQVTGTKTVTNTGNNTAGQPVYSISVNGSLILANGNGTISWVSNRTRTWTAGYNTSDWSDDQYLISGSGTLTRANGNTVGINITTPLMISLGCRWIESGVVELTPQGNSVRTLDYGNGNCDAQANFTVNGQTYSITLR